MVNPPDLPPALNDPNHSANLDTLSFGDDGPSVVLRNADTNDISKLLEILQEAQLADPTDASLPPAWRPWHETCPRNTKAFEAILADQGQITVADVGADLPVGFSVIRYEVTGPDAYSASLELSPSELRRSLQLETVFIRHGCTGQQLDHGLVMHLLENAARRGYTLALAAVPATDRISKRKLEALGFKPVAAREDD